MGDRANVVILDGANAPLYLYTHWRGSELPDIVAPVLARKQRWDDPAYLARMVFSAMVPAEDRDAETGYGIATSMQDNAGGRPLLVLDCDKHVVRFVPEGDASEGRWHCGPEIPFEKATAAALRKKYTG